MQGQVAIVTGAAGGIGRAIVEVLLQRGCRVVAWDLDVSRLQTHSAIRENRLVLNNVDVTDSLALDAATAIAESEHGGVAVLVNNAGANGPTVPIAEYRRSDWDRIIAINLTAVFEICQRIAPAMQQRGYGRIINVASVVGVRGIANACAYSASKSGLIGFTKGLAKELASSGVTANCVAPALIETPLLKQMSQDYIQGSRSRIPMGRAGTSEEVASTVGWIASPDCSFTTGAVFDVSGGRLEW